MQERQQQEDEVEGREPDHRRVGLRMRVPMASPPTAEQQHRSREREQVERPPAAPERDTEHAEVEQQQIRTQQVARIPPGAHQHRRRETAEHGEERHRDGIEANGDGEPGDRDRDHQRERRRRSEQRLFDDHHRGLERREHGQIQERLAAAE